MKTLALLLPLLLAAQANAVVWTATLPDGGGTMVAATTSWGVSVSYSDYPSAESTSITGRTTYTVTTRTADSPLTLSLMEGENWDFRNALDNHWVLGSALGLDGVTRTAEFYPERHVGDVSKAMYSSSGDSHIAVPEPAWSWAGVPLALYCFFLRQRKSAPTRAN